MKNWTLRLMIYVCMVILLVGIPLGCANSSSVEQEQQVSSGQNSSINDDETKASPTEEVKGEDAPSNSTAEVKEAEEVNETHEANEANYSSDTTENSSPSADENAVNPNHSTGSNAAAESHTSTETKPSPVQEKSPEELAVHISIVGDEDAGTILSSTKVKIEEGDTIIDVLKKVTRDQKIQMEFRGKGKTAYVEGIQNLYEFDKGPTSGWIVAVNGELISKSSGAIEVKAGDQIEWFYTLDLGKDYGEKNQ